MISRLLVGAGDDASARSRSPGRSGRTPPTTTSAPARARSTMPGDLVGLGRRDERAHVEVVGLGRVAPLDRADLVGQLRDERVVDVGPGDDPGRRGAVLAAVPVAGRLERLGREVEVGVVEDHDRRLAAELEVEPLHGPGRDLGDPLAGRGVAGDRDHPDLGVADELVADRRARARQDVDDAGRQVLGEDLGEAQRGQRRPDRRLEDDRVAGRERRPELPAWPCRAGSSTARSRRRRRSGRAG